MATAVLLALQRQGGGPQLRGDGLPQVVGTREGGSGQQAEQG
jgi:hypothetical protein